MTNICTQNDCNEPHYANHLCRRHYDLRRRCYQVTRTCLRCNREFHPRKTSPGDYCSASCRSNARRAHVCQQCGVEFIAHRTSSPGHFCSLACKNESMRKTEVKPCQQCGTEMIGKPSRFRRYQGRSFCSKKCHGEWRRCNPTAVRFGAVLSARRRAIYGHECVICGETRYVEYAHKISARDGGTIHPDNIYVLCPTHHSLLDYRPDFLTATELDRLKTVSETSYQLRETSS